MPSFILRKIDDALWDKVKEQAAKEGRPLRWMLMRLLALYADVGLETLEKVHQPHDIEAIKARQQPRR